MSVPYKPTPTRAERRAAAREAAKLLVNQTPPKIPKFRWDYTLASVAAIMGVLIVFFPPQDVTAYCVWLAAVYGLAIYPGLHFAEWIFPRRKLLAGLTLLGLAAIVAAIGAYKWPPVGRHTLSERERMQFENALKPQKGSDLEVQMVCSPSDERICTYAEQFIRPVGDAGWKVQAYVSRLMLSKPLDGIMIYRRGGNRDYTLQHYDAGGYFNISDSHLLAMQKAFQAIGIEPGGGTDPDIPENTMMIYFGPERENEAESTDLTRATEWATGTRIGPFPGKRNTKLCRWFSLFCD